MKESLGTGNEGNLLVMKANTMNRIKKLTAPLQPDFLNLSAEADVSFLDSIDTTGLYSTSVNMTMLCKNYGKIFSPSLPECFVSGLSGSALLGATSKITLLAKNSEGEPFEKPIKLLDCELVSEVSGTKLGCSIERRGGSEYEISYHPVVKGRHRLHIKAEGQHIKGSPFSVAVKIPVEKLSSPILTIGSVWKPWGVAFSQDGEAVVTEAHRCVSVFNPNGEKTRSFGRRGSGKKQFNSPSGVAVGSKGDIIVADSYNHRIQMFTRDGQFLTAVGTKGSGPLQFSDPCGVAFNASNGKVYITDETVHHIQVLNSNLTFSSTFGKHGSGKGQFSSPHGIACDGAGKVYVADTDNHRVQVFTAEGKFWKVFGRHGQGKGELARPYGVAVDADNMVYVSELGNHRVSVFTSEGQFVTSFGKWGEGSSVLVV